MIGNETENLKILGCNIYVSDTLKNVEWRSALLNLIYLLRLKY